ncbi:MAG: single-stranded-DNA-specific exonuclease RecJ, partial [Chloroflexi bacterium]|nr:single-stranded-DNA-specific exonuclease RecJ [Chloroflexota bacterium]
MKRKWAIATPAPNLTAYEHLIPWAQHALRRRGLLLPPDPLVLVHLVGQILYSRDIAPENALTYLEGAVEGGNPLDLKGVGEAVERVRRAIHAAEPIAVYGDYDADGISATALLVTVLRSLGARVMGYIPHRVDEGYGLNNDSLRVLKAQGIQLVITVDCGVRAAAEAAYARSIGLELIVTDHHAVPPTLPDAIVINPRQPGCPYPFKDLCGVGLAYKLACALLTTPDVAPSVEMSKRPPAESLLDLVALGTVADIVPLRGENRALVRQGLALLNKPQRVGVQALLAQARIKPGHVQSGTIAFALGPRLNAAGRMDHAKLSFDLLMSTDRPAAEALAVKLDEVNRERQEATRTCVEQARATILVSQKDAPVIVVADEGYPQGIVGLVAGRLIDEFYRPALVVERGPETSKGSARSIPEFNIIEALDQCADLFVKHGGHKAAAGFTLNTSRLSDLQSRLTDIARQQFDGQPPEPSIHADAVVSFRELDRPLLFLLEQLEPCGAENPPSRFVSR